jgi:hypothetical protein
MWHIRHANIRSRLDNDYWGCGRRYRVLDQGGVILINSSNDRARGKRAAQSAKHAEQERKGHKGVYRGTGWCIGSGFRLFTEGEELRGSD